MRLDNALTPVNARGVSPPLATARPEPVCEPCPCGGDVLLYREAGLPPIFICVDCHRWEPAEPHTATEGR